MNNTARFTEDQLLTGLDLAGVEVDEVRTDYSGRSMYGATCFGIVHGASDMSLGFGILFAIAEADAGTTDLYEAIEAAQEMTEAARGDNMGRSTITYFPGWDLAGTETDGLEG